MHSTCDLLDMTLQLYKYCGVWNNSLSIGNMIWPPVNKYTVEVRVATCSYSTLLWNFEGEHVFVSNDMRRCQNLVHMSRINIDSEVWFLFLSLQPVEFWSLRYAACQLCDPQHLVQMERHFGEESSDKLTSSLLTMLLCQHDLTNRLSLCFRYDYRFGGLSLLDIIGNICFCKFSGNDTQEMVMHRHNCNALGSYRFWVVLRCSVHVRNHLQTLLAKFVFAYFDHTLVKHFFSLPPARILNHSSQWFWLSHSKLFLPSFVDTTTFPNRIYGLCMTLFTFALAHLIFFTAFESSGQHGNTPTNCSAYHHVVWQKICSEKTHTFAGSDVLCLGNWRFTDIQKVDALLQETATFRSPRVQESAVLNPW